MRFAPSIADAIHDQPSIRRVIFHHFRTIAPFNPCQVNMVFHNSTLSTPAATDFPRSHKRETDAFGRSRRPSAFERPPTDQLSWDDESEGESMFDLRVADRYRDTAVSRIKCNRGNVLDFSTRGLRISSRRLWSPGELKSITLKLDKQSITVVAEGAWCRERVAGKREIGVAFATLTPDAAATLDHFWDLIAPPGILTLPTGEHIGLTTTRRAA